MKYEPIKAKIGFYLNRKPVLRILFYKLLDLLLLRTWHIHREIKIWAKGIKKGTLHILDAGCGFGQYTYFLSNYCPNWNVLGIDINSDHVADCNLFFNKIKQNNVYFKTGDILKFDTENSFDLVLSVDVMEHIKEDELAFKNIYRCLKKEGMLLISTPSDQGGSDADNQDDVSFIEEHVRNGYNIQDIKEKLLRAGFQRVKARYSYGPLGSLAWKLSMKYPILMLGKSFWLILLLPFYYVVAYPISYILNWWDVHTGHLTGTGLIVKAWK